MFLALRELQHYKFRSLLIGGIVALIAFMVFMLTGSPTAHREAETAKAHRG